MHLTFRFPVKESADLRLAGQGPAGTASVSDDRDLNGLVITVRELDAGCMRWLRASREAEMIALFLRTELPSDRWKDDLRALLAGAGLPDRVITTPDLGDAAENQARQRLLTEHRGYGTRTGFFDGFPDHLCWQWMAITPVELAEVRYIRDDYWDELSGGTRLAVDAAARIRAGVAPFGVPNDRVLGMAQAVTGGARFPPLILVTTGLGGDLVVLEGHVRLTALMLARDQLPPELEVLAGSSPRITRWDCW